MRYLEHRPNYFSGYEQKEVQFTALDELLKTETVVGSFAKAPDLIKLSLSPRQDLCGIPYEYRHLMAEMVDGTHWVTGFIFGTDDELAILGLPTWEGRKNG